MSFTSDLPRPVRRIGRFVKNCLRGLFKPNTAQAAQASSYEKMLAAENETWGKHLQVEALELWQAWLDHPLINAHYGELASLGGMRWEESIKRYLGGPAEKSLELGGAGFRSLLLWRLGSCHFIESVDVSAARIAEGDARRRELGASGRFWVADVNKIDLPAQNYDLIFAAHSFHHFLELEYIMGQVAQALTPRGIFVLEEYVGPTQFQFTRQQLEIANQLLHNLPERLRRYQDGRLKQAEPRPLRENVIAASPFESIRSAEIAPLFYQNFETIAVRNLGGTLQQLIYNGIAHNFHTEDSEAVEHIRRIYGQEDRLISSGELPSDFMLLIGKPKLATQP